MTCRILSATPSKHILFEVLILIMTKKANICSLKIDQFLQKTLVTPQNSHLMEDFKDCLHISQKIHKHKQGFIIVRVKTKFLNKTRTS